MDANGAVGFAVAPDGDIEVVFANKAKGAPPKSLYSIIPQAIANGGTKLDCYGPDLVSMYNIFGFEPAARVAFDPGRADPGWTPDKGTPYIYFMAHNGDSADEVAQSIGRYRVWSQEALDALPLMDYDRAYAYRDLLLRRDDADAQKDARVLALKAGLAAKQQPLREKAETRKRADEEFDRWWYDGEDPPVFPEDEDDLFTPEEYAELDKYIHGQILAEKEEVEPDISDDEISLYWDDDTRRDTSAEQRIPVKRPEALSYDERKLIYYLLDESHARGGPKARFLREVLGYTKNDAKLFHRNVIEAIAGKIPDTTTLTEYGTKYTYHTELIGKHGSTVKASVVVVIQRDNGKTTCRIITVYPDKKGS